MAGLVGGQYEGLKSLQRQEWHVQRTRSGIIGGVIFNLEHPAVPPGAWNCPRLIARSADDPQGYFIRPSKDRPGRFSIGAGLLGAPRGSVGNVDVMADAPDASANRVIGPGEIVRIIDVTAVERSRLGHEADREERIARVEVWREGGRLEELAPLTFHARGSTLNGLDEWRAFETISERIAHRHGLEAIGDYAPISPLARGGLSEDEQLLSDAQELQTLWSAFKDELGGGVSPALGLLDPAWQRLSALDRLVNKALLLGFRQARLEADVDAVPKAKKAIASADGAVRGGVERGKLETERVWKEYGEAALRIAAEVHGAGVSNMTEIIRRVRGRWPAEGTGFQLPVSDRAIIAFLKNHPPFRT